MVPRFAFLTLRDAFALTLGGTTLWPEGKRGAAAAIMRANPFSAMFAHCQLTFSRSSSGKLAVVHTRFTSQPGAVSVSALHSQTRPSSSVTRRDAIVGVSMSWAANRCTVDGLAEPQGSNRRSRSCEKSCRRRVSFVTCWLRAGVYCSDQGFNGYGIVRASPAV